jgi:hypothetical protein
MLIARGAGAGAIPPLTNSSHRKVTDAHRSGGQALAKAQRANVELQF